MSDYTESERVVRFQHCPKCAGCASMKQRYCSKPSCVPEVLGEHLHAICQSCGYEVYSLCLDALKRMWEEKWKSG